MGKGRDKRKKNEDPAKAAKRAAKQASKLHKHLSKGEGDGEGATAPAGFNNEESIEVTLRRIQKTQGKLRTIEEVENVEPPTPRANVVFSQHPVRPNELIIFGGEFWNGERTEAYNETYFYHVKRGVWSRLSCAVNPAPRSSSQGVVFKHYLIIFGGEFVSQTQSQYLHFKDVWRYNANTSEWEELKTLKNGPSSRSGHRMAMWRRNAVVFGGFYDNAQECRYFNDLWVLSNLEGAGQWMNVKTSTAGEVPHARSGHSLATHGDNVFVYGGYSTERFNRFKKSEATVHHDLWMLNLAAATSSSSSSAATVGGAHADPNAMLPVWTKIRLGGVPPPIRSGVSAAFRDKKMYLFGGVVDIESPGGSMVSTFYNDLFVLHMDSKRFYPVVMRSGGGAAKRGGGEGAASRKLAGLNDLEAELDALRLREDDDDDDDEEESDIDLEDDDEEDGKNPNAATSAPAITMKVSYETNRHGQHTPHRRMDASLLIVGNQLYIFGGQFESGKKEITLADLFALNLNALDGYQVLHSQDLSAAVWMGKESDSAGGSWESGSTVVSAAFDYDYDDDDDEDEDDDDDESGVDFGRMPKQQVLEEGDDDDEAPEAIPAELPHHATPSQAVVSASIDNLTRGGKKGLHVHKEQLLAQLGATASIPTPAMEERFADFFNRTETFWMSTARESHEGGGGTSASAIRRLRKEAAEFARRRYHEAKELLTQLSLVKEREEAEAKFFRERQQRKEEEWDAYEAEQRRLAEEGEKEEEEAGETKG